MRPLPRPVRPRPGQESVWDYPRPPIVVPSDRHVVIEHGGLVLADTRRAVRVLETASPPAWYLPPDDVRTDLMEPLAGASTVCEWKGTATYLDLVVGGRRTRMVAWTYREPSPRYGELGGWLAFFGGRVDRISVDGERVRPQPGGYYGGWVTDDVVGPFKGEPGTEGW